jgi:CrcB protein
MNLPMLSGIALGGALGALARYGLGGWIQQLSGGTFPWGTWAINVAGSLFLGLVIRLFEGLAVDPAWRAFLAIGLAGGFTTFSTFSYESLKLLQDGEVPSALLYMAGSVVGALLAVLAGFLLAGWILHWRG